MMIDAFIHKLDHERISRKTNIEKHTNLTRHEESALKWLRNEKNLVALMADKNLGIVIVHKQTYIQ